MEFLDVLRKKSMKVREFQRWGVYFRKRCDDVLIIKDASLLSMDDILRETDDMYKGDIYIVDKDFTWTFVKTHEHRWCGPYFTRKC
ncbi:DUF4275 family protein [Bacillus cereus]|uniref:DUF4275 family protein n=1 Tax=Bacillus TaxID=1386 RepID=UPI001F565991|nr:MULTISPECIES: DUF4275 family protein [Bacillus cereus group]MCU4991060.1 DUF4275 family protein [Bacillus cereus]USL13405.1 DUF4275 family protein [Bacillus thuringiensis]